MRRMAIVPQQLTPRFFVCLLGMSLLGIIAVSGNESYPHSIVSDSNRWSNRSRIFINIAILGIL